MNIIKTAIDYDKLDKQIDTAELLHGYDSYVCLVMSRCTGDKLCNCPEDEIFNSSTSSNMLCAYSGYPVFIDDNLSFGEVKVLIEVK